MCYPSPVKAFFRDLYSWWVCDVHNGKTDAGETEMWRLEDSKRNISKAELTLHSPCYRKRKHVPIHFYYILGVALLSLVLLKHDMPSFVDTHGRPAPFWTETEEEWIGGRLVWERNRSGGEVLRGEEGEIIASYKINLKHGIWIWKSMVKMEK